MVEWKESKIKSIHQIPMVAEVPLIVKDKATGYKAIVNSETNETICVIPVNYQFIQHRKIVEQVKNLEKFTTKDIQLLKNGRQLYVEVSDRTPQKIELLPNDYIERRVRIINSYDKNRSLVLQGYGIRLVCENGAVAPKAISGKKHIYAFGTNAFKGELEQRIEEIMNSWNEAKELMVKAKNTIVSVKDIIPEFNLLPKKYMKIVIENLDEKESVYDIWNEFTRVVTHYVQPKVRTSCLLGAQKKVNKILELVVREGK